MLFIVLLGFWLASCSKDDSFKLSNDFAGRFVLVNSAFAQIGSNQLYTLDKFGLTNLSGGSLIDSSLSQVKWIEDGSLIMFQKHRVCLCPAFYQFYTIQPNGLELKNLLSLLEPTYQFHLMDFLLQLHNMTRQYYRAGRLIFIHWTSIYIRFCWTL